MRPGCFCCAAALLLALPSAQAASFKAAARLRGGAAPLAEGWKETQDPNTGRTYYWNTKTRAVTWTRPVEAKPPAKTPAAKRANGPPAPPARAYSSAVDRSTVALVRDADGTPILSSTPDDAGQPQSFASRVRSALGESRARIASAGDTLRYRVRLDEDVSTQGILTTARKGLYLGSVLAAAAAFL